MSPLQTMFPSTFITRTSSQIAYDYLVTVMGGIYTATDAEGEIVAASASLLTVMNAIKAAGVHIQFGAGTFDYGSNTVTFNGLHGIQFWGAGIDVTVVQNSSSAASDTEVFNFTACDNVIIRDLTVSAGGSARSTSDAIDNDGGSDWLIERVKVTASRARGIAIDGKDPGASAERCIVRDCVIVGSGLQGTTAGDGIELLGATDCLIDNCTITATPAHGIQISKGSTASGKKSSGNIVRNCAIELAGRDGVNILSSDGNRVEGCTITDSATTTSSKDGIRIETVDSVSADDNVFDGNTCTDTRGTKRQRYGVNIGPASAGLANRNEITNNILTGNLTGAYSDGGTDSVISGNTI